MSLLHHPDVMVLVAGGRESGRLLQDGISGAQGGDTGGPIVPHHLQCGGGYDGLALGQVYGRERRRAGRALTG